MWFIFMALVIILLFSVLTGAEFPWDLKEYKKYMSKKNYKREILLSCILSATIIASILIIIMAVVKITQ